MTALAVIPARGGSKGIPRKNLLPVGGRPLMTWTIAQALGAGDDVIVAVSTEDAEIADVARAHGARVIDRPVELAADTAPTEPTILHAMDVIEAEGVEYRSYWHLPEGVGESARADYDVTARPRRQELIPHQMHYFENGSLYVTAPHIYRTCKNRIGGRVDLFVLDEMEGVDIDTLTDVAAAESMLARMGWRTS